MRRFVLAALFTTTACSGRATIAPLAPLPFPADTVRSELVSNGVVHRYIYSPTGPWAIHVLDVALEKCNAAVAVKGADSAAARIKTTAMLNGLSARAKVLGGVNADFFSLANGTPTNLLVVDGRMMTPPSKMPVLAIDSSGVPHIDTFTLNGGTLSPFHPKEAVGGRPVLVRDSVLMSNLDSAGGVAFASARHPRTAAGIARNGKRLILAVVDGRQAPYSDGMSLRELANLMLALGARDALNLDGGGSSTLVFADPALYGTRRIANKPSDAGGERTVGDALAIVNRCERP
jgi:exopolysaccharide biosynthesis protein